VCKSCARMFYYSFAFVLTKLQPVAAKCRRSWIARFVARVPVFEQGVANSLESSLRDQARADVSSIGNQRLSSLLPSARREVHRIVASCTASPHARSYSWRLIHSSIVCGSFCPAPKVTVGTP